MAAFNELEVIEQIENFQTLAIELAKVQTRIFQVLENSEVVNQTWSDLGTDFPSMVGGTQTSDDPILINGVEQGFSPQHVTKFKQAIEKFRDAFDGVQPTIATNLGRNIRRLTRGVV